MKDLVSVNGIHCNAMQDIVGSNDSVLGTMFDYLQLFVLQKTFVIMSSSRIIWGEGKGKNNASNVLRTLLKRIVHKFNMLTYHSSLQSAERCECAQQKF